MAAPVYGLPVYDATAAPAPAKLVGTDAPPAIESVAITGWTDNASVTFYEVETTLGDGHKVKQQKRYTQFAELHAGSGGPHFSVPKQMFMSPADKDKRADDLQAYLRLYLRSRSTPGLRTFLLGDSAPSAVAAGDPPAPRGHASPADARLAAVDASMPSGLRRALESSCASFPLRVMIVDNSGSMGTPDGSRLVGRAGRLAPVKSTRWQELGSDVVSLAKIAIALETRLDLRLLNPSGGFSCLTVGRSAPDECVPPLGEPVGIAAVEGLVGTSPTGGTPLTDAVRRVIAQLAPAAAQLRGRGQRAAVIIATDGLPNDPPSFLAAVAELQALPVWLVVRLCTDDQSVVSYWNGLDSALEAPLEVLDDAKGEAEEVRGAGNGWLTYGQPLHLARCFGMPEALFDALDERTLLPSQCRELLQLILGCDLPEPEIDAAAFGAALARAVRAAPLAYDPLAARERPWVDEAAVGRLVRGGAGGACCVM